MHIRPLFFALILAYAPPQIIGADPLAVAGKIVLRTDPQGATIFGLLSPRTLELVAVLNGDPDILNFRIDEWVVLQTEFSGATYLGLPSLKVVDLLPDRWEQPSILDHFEKGFGAYSGFGMEPGFADYAMTSFEDRRADPHDTGETLPNLIATFAGNFEVEPLSLFISKSAGNATLSWNARAGLRYDLLTSPTVQGSYTYNAHIIPSDDGPVSVSFPATLDQQFFRLRY